MIIKKCGFEIAKGWEDNNINLPQRSTQFSAGYDIECAENTVIPSIYNNIKQLKNLYSKDITKITYDAITSMIKENKLKLTLVPTGLKAYMEEDQVLKLYCRSSVPLNSYLMLGNEVGIIDSDYYNNESNDGHISFQFINFAPYDILIPKGTKIGQGVFEQYCITENDIALGKRTGGFGSTNA